MSYTYLVRVFVSPFSRECRASFVFSCLVFPIRVVSRSCFQISSVFRGAIVGAFVFRVFRVDCGGVCVPCSWNFPSDVVSRSCFLMSFYQNGASRSCFRVLC